MESTGRLFLCACCREQVLTCRRCDRGQRYCRCCAQEVRRAKVREAGRRYQKSRQGRFADAARSRRHPERRPPDDYSQTMRGRSIILTRASASKYRGPACPLVVLRLNDQNAHLKADLNRR